MTEAETKAAADEAAKAAADKAPTVPTVTPEAIAAAKLELAAEAKVADAKAASDAVASAAASVAAAKDALGPHTPTLDELVRTRKITPAERKGIETSLAKGDTAGMLLAILSSRSVGAGAATGPQVGADGTNPVLQYVEAQNALRSK